MIGTQEKRHARAAIEVLEPRQLLTTIAVDAHVNGDNRNALYYGAANASDLTLAG